MSIHRFPFTMIRRLIHIEMLFRGALMLAPFLVAGLATGNPLWTHVEIVTISTFIAAERSQLTPLGVLLHAMAIAAAFIALSLSMASPVLFVLATALLAAACALVMTAGQGMRWTGIFTFLPSVYLACGLAGSARGSFSGVDWAALPYVIIAGLPAILGAIAPCLAKTERASVSSWRAWRRTSEPSAKNVFTTALTAALAVGAAATLVSLQHVQHEQWMVWSAACVVTGDLPTALAKWKDRALGAVTGVPLGMLAAMLMPHSALLAPMLTIAIALTLVSFHHYAVGFGVRCALQAIAIIVAGHVTLAADVRTINVIVGGSIGLLSTVGMHYFSVWLKGRGPVAIDPQCNAS